MCLIALDTDFEDYEKAEFNVLLGEILFLEGELFECFIYVKLCEAIL